MNMNPTPIPAFNEAIAIETITKAEALYRFAINSGHFTFVLSAVAAIIAILTARHIVKTKKAAIKYNLTHGGDRSYTSPNADATLFFSTCGSLALLAIGGALTGVNSARLATLHAAPNVWLQEKHPDLVSNTYALIEFPLVEPTTLVKAQPVQPTILEEALSIYDHIRGQDNDPYNTAGTLPTGDVLITNNTVPAPTPREQTLAEYISEAMNRDND